MYTIINITTGKEIRTHNMFRVSEPFPGVELEESERLVYIPEVLLPLLNFAYECIIAVDEDGIAVAITITKTMEQYWQEKPSQPPQPTEDDYLIDLDFRLSMIELGL